MKPLVEFLDSEDRLRVYYLVECSSTYTVECQFVGEPRRRIYTQENDRVNAVRSLARLALRFTSESYSLMVRCPEVQAAMEAIREEQRAYDEQLERERTAAAAKRAERIRLDAEALVELKATYKLRTKPGTASVKLWRGPGVPDTTETITGLVAEPFILHAAPFGNRVRVTHIPTGHHLGVDLPSVAARLLTAILLHRFDWSGGKPPPSVIREVQEIRDMVEKESWNSLRQRLLTSAIHR